MQVVLKVLRFLMLSQEDATNFFAYANKTLIKERMNR